jgi:hypothetical protein
MGVPLLGALLWFSHATTARAELKECGNVFLQGDAKCEYREKEQCMTTCTTESVETACVAKLYTTCQNQCTTTASTSCESTCSQGCMTDCQASVTTPEPPTCMELCAADCDKTCSDGGRGPRGGCCSHTCNARCEDKCKDAPPVMKPEECTTTCSNACSGSCTAQVNVQCQLDCQTTTYNECQTELVETCQTKCEDDGGAIFCDGQFVNASNAKSCADELKSKLNFDLHVNVQAGATAVVNTTADTTKDAVSTTKKKSKELCSVSSVGAGEGGMGGAALFGLCATVLGAQRMRKRRAARAER